MSLAFFDMDGTLVGGDTNDITLHHFVKLGIAPSDMLVKLSECERKFFEGSLDINDFVRFAVTPLLKLSKDEQYKVLHETVRDLIIPLVKPGAKRALDFHKKRGDRIFIVTSTCDYIVEHVASLLGISDYIAAPMEKVDGRLTGKQCGIVPYQEDKVKRINEILKKDNLSLEDSYAYGDSINDLPMLMMCTHRFAVDPNEKLLNHPDLKALKVVNWKE